MVRRQVELVPGGRERPVTAGNRLEYIHRVANFRLNTQIKRPADAFQRGLEEVIAREWVALFNEGELQVACSGCPPAPTGPACRSPHTWHVEQQAGVTCLPYMPTWPGRTTPRWQAACTAQPPCNRMPAKHQQC